MNDANIYKLCAENAHAQNEQPKMVVDGRGDKAWYLHGELHREDGAAIEYANGDRCWFLHGELHREDGAAIEYANGDRCWFLHGKRHRDNGPAVEYANGDKWWYLHGNYYKNANDWAKDVLKLHDKPCDDAAAENYLRTILTKDDLI